MDPDIKAKICKLYKLPPDHELIQQTELIFLQLEHENSFQEQLAMIRNLEEITSNAIHLNIQVVSTR